MIHHVDGEVCCQSMHLSHREGVTEPEQLLLTAFTCITERAFSATELCYGALALAANARDGTDNTLGCLLRGAAAICSRVAVTIEPESLGFS